MGMDAQNFFLEGEHAIRLGEGAEMRCLLGGLEHLCPGGATGRSRAVPPLGGEGRLSAKAGRHDGVGRHDGNRSGEATQANEKETGTIPRA
jgi:hypothetical protein